MLEMRSISVQYQLRLNIITSHKVLTFTLSVDSQYQLTQTLLPDVRLEDEQGERRGGEERSVSSALPGTSSSHRDTVLSGE